MTAAEFVKLSTALVQDMTKWVAEASKNDTLTPADLALLQAALKVVERVTLTEAASKPDTAN